MDSNAERAEHGELIEITDVGRIDFGQRMQVVSSDANRVVVLDNRVRVNVPHGQYKVVRRCGRPAIAETPPKKRGRPSNAELAAREAGFPAAVELPKPKVVAKADATLQPSSISDDEAFRRLDSALYDVPVTRKQPSSPCSQTAFSPVEHGSADKPESGKLETASAGVKAALQIDESKVTVVSNDVSAEAAAALAVGFDAPSEGERGHRIDAALYSIGAAQLLGVDLASEPDRTGVTITQAGLKHDAEKVRMDLLDPLAIEQLAAVLTFGAQKYEAHNWRKGIAFGRLTAAALRHIFTFMRGEDNDPESGLPHIAHAMCCCMFLLALAPRPELDDRVKDAA